MTVLKTETVVSKKTINSPMTADSVLKNANLADEILQFIVIKEKNNKAITLNVGTTGTGKEIADAYDLAALGYIVLEPVGVSRTARDLYFTSSDWNGAKLEIKVINLKV